MSPAADPVSLRRDREVRIITIDNPPVNALSTAVRAGLVRALRQAAADDAVQAIVLVCAGRSFIAGADISEFGKPPQAPSLPDVIAALDASPKPIIAAIQGSALGGGLEVALACHYRIAAASARLGLPEVKLGLLPGAGGTQRLPRAVGVATALEMIALGEPVSASAALKSGLIDRVAQGEDLLADAVAFAREQIAAGAAPRRLSAAPAPLAEAAVFEAFRKTHARRFRGFAAPAACIEAVEASARLPFADGVAQERSLFLGLLSGDQSAAQRHVFFAERTAAKVPGLPADAAPRPIGRVGVIGAGTMGGGIAMSFLNAGLPVVIVEAKPEALERGLATIRATYEAAAAKGRLSPEALEARLAALSGALSYTALADCDLIVEAVFEDMAVKKSVFAQLDAVAKPGAILASNTSYLDLDEIAAATGRPESVVGLHFFSPAHIMKLLEVVRGAKTAPDVVATAMQLGKTLGKVAVLVGVCFGFIGNRMLAQRQREATKLVLEGALPWDVDRVLYDFGLPMGPFAMSDLAGLDLGWSRETSKGETLRERLCERDRRGQKTGAGYYDYDAARRTTPSAVTEQIILDLCREQGRERRLISDQEILERCLFPMINEAAKILEEGIALRASDIDVVWVSGYGWPTYTGGPMYWADKIGLKTVLAGLKDHAQALGPEAAPAPLLERLAGADGRFADL
ncbi:3-hydroxyacyl-CoA dehydrogenase NAD-binding domain-containing protein [Caulobacter soli]|uniref:3-hydroxyacyl-CoA dehydrogenase NAD-binding domain-containing protein n=1 Tax=Caulobacter soli TaxID=2708539 RepID=UPI003CCCE1C9